MELSMIAIELAPPEVDPKDGERVTELLLELRVPFNPCARIPRHETDPDGTRRLLVIVTPAVQAKLREAGRRFKLVRDYADVPDPRTYVSRTNRYAKRLAELRAAKGGR